MSLTLELPPEVEARLVEEATRRGLSVSEVVALLVQGYFWPAESSLITEWYRQENRRSLYFLKQAPQFEQRERLVAALTQKINLEAQIAHEERAIVRCERESVRAAQSGERAASLKSYQTKILHEQRREELRRNLPDAAAIAEKLRAELRDRDANVLTNMVEQTRMKLQRNRADILLGKPASQHIVEYELETRIRKYASEAAWNTQYTEWIAAHGDSVPDEAPSEIEVMQQVGEQTQQLLNKQIQRLEELLNAAKAFGTGTIRIEVFTYKRIFAFLALSLLCLSGCGKHNAGQVPNAQGNADAPKQNGTGKAEEAKATELPGAVRGTGWHIPWYAPDLKHPDRPLQRVLIADAKAGAMDSDNDVAAVRLQDVQATLYHDGKPSATLTAPRVTTNEQDRVIVATGGVTIHSLISPTGKRAHSAVPANSTVTADKMVWDSHTTKVVCTGHARLVSKQPGSSALESYSEKIIYDTETGDVDFRYNTRPGK